MKVLFVDMQYDYGQKSRGINAIGLLGFKKAIENLGHKVETFFYDDYLHGKNEKLQNDLLTKASDVNPDLIFFCLFKDQFKVETLQKLKTKYKTMNWFGDDTWRFDNFTNKYAPYFTYCITTDKYSIPKYSKIESTRVIRAQWAAIDDERFFDNKQYKYDVSFVGGFNPYRNWFVGVLKKHGIEVQCFGNGWKNGPLSNDQMIELFKTSKINLNISNSASYDLRYLVSHPKNVIHTLRTKKQISQIKARNFEINYYGGFQLTDYAPTIEEYYNLGQEIACYSTPEEAALQIKYYLENNEEREKIKQLGQKRAQDGYTYTGQFKKIFKELNL